jgi:hypothetical protein
MTERRFDRDGKLLTDEEPETKMSLSDLLDKRRADALAKEEDEKRADQLDALRERLSGPVTAQDLQRKAGGADSGVIDAFFTDADGDFN